MDRHFFFENLGGAAFTYRDGLGEWRAGDHSNLDSEHTHEPIAIGDEPCICLIATSAPLELKTMLGKVLQPLVRL